MKNPKQVIKPTEEQVAIVKRAKAGESFSITAVAGSGKTTTLRMIAEAIPGPTLYLAFNRAMAEEARKKFPKSVEVRTLHSLAWKEVVAEDPRLQAKFEAGKGEVTPGHILKYVELEEVFGYAKVSLAFGVAEAVKKRLWGLDFDLPPHVEDKKRERLRAYILTKAEEALRKMMDPDDPFPLSHDGYVRLWGERGGKGLERYRTILVDEAQDLNPNLLAPLLEWKERDGQLILVGDPFQRIYDWRGAVNAMEALPQGGLLSQSFRFGEAIARLASRITGLPIQGNPEVASEVIYGRWKGGGAALFRTNLALLEELAESGGRVIGGVEEAASLIEAALALRQGKPAYHPLLAFFRTWKEVEEASTLSPELRGLKWFLTRHPNPWTILEKARQKGGTWPILSTIHRAKGLEWDQVYLADPPKEEEKNLLYVAVTRARRTLMLAA